MTSSSSIGVQMWAQQWNNTAAITEVTVISINGYTFVAGSWLGVNGVA